MDILVKFPLNLDENWCGRVGLEPSRHDCGRHIMNNSLRQTELKITAWNTQPCNTISLFTSTGLKLCLEKGKMCLRPVWSSASQNSYDESRRANAKVEKHSFSSSSIKTALRSSSSAVLEAFSRNLVSIWLLFGTHCAVIMIKNAATGPKGSLKKPREV